MADYSMSPSQFPEFPAVVTHGGQFVQYNIFGNLFEITTKYRPPIMPIGRGAYGIVWYLLCNHAFFFFIWFVDAYSDSDGFWWFELKLDSEFGD